MENIKEITGQEKNAAILGHVRPDGDCVGSCLALKNYIAALAPQMETQIYLEKFPESFMMLDGAGDISHDPDENITYELCIVLDVSDKERLGKFSGYFDAAGRTVCIDHHITNDGNFADLTHVSPERSSTCELLFTLMDDELIDEKTAECLYMGIVHDTGVFRHTNTTGDTLRAAGRLVEKGVPYNEIIEKTFYEKTYRQNQILGRMLTESVMFMDGRCIFSVMRHKMMEFYRADSRDLEGVIDHLRETKGVECAILLSEIRPQVYKVSLRSNNIVDVSKVASYFGGGGHLRAAGCTMVGSPHDVLNNLSEHIAEQLAAAGEM